MFLQELSPDLTRTNSVRNWTSMVVKWYRDQKMYKRLSWLLHSIFSRILWESVYSIWNNPQWIYKRSVFWRGHYFPKRKVYHFFFHNRATYFVTELFGEYRLQLVSRFLYEKRNNGFDILLQLFFCNHFYWNWNSQKNF